MQIDERLCKAHDLARESGLITPLLKEELWCKIQFRRMSEGLEELSVNFDGKTSNAQLSEEEKAKAEKRRKMNREAAARCRQRTKQKKIKTEKDLNCLLEENHSFKRKISELEEEIAEYKQKLRALGCLLSTCTTNNDIIHGQTTITYSVPHHSRSPPPYPSRYPSTETACATSEPQTETACATSEPQTETAWVTSPAPTDTAMAKYQPQTETVIATSPPPTETAWTTCPPQTETVWDTSPTLTEAAIATTPPPTETAWATSPPPYTTSYLSTETAWITSPQSLPEKQYNPEFMSIHLPPISPNDQTIEDVDFMYSDHEVPV